MNVKIDVGNSNSQIKKHGFILQQRLGEEIEVLGKGQPKNSKNKDFV